MEQKELLERVLRDGLHSIMIDNNISVEEYKLAEELVEAMLDELKDFNHDCSPKL